MSFWTSLLDITNIRAALVAVYTFRYAKFFNPFSDEKSDHRLCCLITCLYGNGIFCEDICKYKNIFNT